ncbi:MAG TPA: hypothetical protein VE131_16030 [Terriglobales bacterium]|nr:hypothetical protein [Terriglobales bacterium]
MCYNCGCQKPDDDHGNPNNITDKTFADAARAANQNADEAKRETLKCLESTLGKK